MITRNFLKLALCDSGVKLEVATMKPIARIGAEEWRDGVIRAGEKTGKF